jgi:hypothetical protein
MADMKKTKTFEGKRHVYNTEASTEIGTRAFGNYGDPSGYEETLYKNRQGLFFVYGRGGENSPYGDGEDIRPLTNEEAEAWQA